MPVLGAAIFTTNLQIWYGQNGIDNWLIDGPWVNFRRDTTKYESLHMFLPIPYQFQKLSNRLQLFLGFEGGLTKREILLYS